MPSLSETESVFEDRLGLAQAGFRTQLAFENRVGLGRARSELRLCFARLPFERDQAANRLRTLSSAAVVLLLVILPINPVATVSLWLPGIGDRTPTDLSLSILPLLSIACVVLWGVATAIDSEHRVPSLGPALLVIPLIALPVLSLVTLPFSINPEHSASTSLYLLLLLGLYLVAVNLPVERWTIAAALALGAAVQAAVGWPQFLLGHSIGLEQLGEYRLEAAWQGVSVVMMGQARLLRAYGLTGHPNQLGGYLMFSIPILAGYLLQTQRMRRSSLGTLGRRAGEPLGSAGDLFAIRVAGPRRGRGRHGRSAEGARRSRTASAQHP